MSHILVVEDEAHLAEGLAYNLRYAGYHVDIVETGEAALEAVDETTYDLLLLDVMLPGISGLDVASKLRRNGFLKTIIIVSALYRSEEAIAGLDAGADDYITKPYDLDELIARIRGALRRQVWIENSSPAEPEKPAAPDTLQYGPWVIDFQRYLATTPDGGEVQLSATELAMLKFFGSRPGEVITRKTFLEEVWGLPGTLETRTVDNFVRKIRRTLEVDSSNPHHIISVRGAGYRFVP